jgi:hypothetical protein
MVLTEEDGRAIGFSARHLSPLLVDHGVKEGMLLEMNLYEENGRLYPRSADLPLEAACVTGDGTPTEISERLWQIYLQNAKDQAHKKSRTQ